METISIDDFELYLTDLCEKEAFPPSSAPSIPRKSLWR